MPAAKQHPSEPGDIEYSGQAGRERRSDMLQRHHEGEVHRQVQRDRGDRDLYRCRGVSTGEEGWREYLDQHESREPERVSGERLCGKSCILTGECAMPE